MGRQQEGSARGTAKKNNGVTQNFFLVFIVGGEAEKKK